MAITRRTCPECKQRELPPDWQGFRALRCYECGLVWLQRTALPGMWPKEAA